MNTSRIAAQRLSLLPNRVAGAGPRSGVTRPGSPAQRAADLFWKCGVECFKPVYARIDARFKLPDRMKDPDIKEKHGDLMDEAKRILQEHRNLIIECVLPMYFVRDRQKDEATSEADEHAHDFFRRNVFSIMIDTLIASLPTFLEKGDIESTGQTVRNLSEVQGERLSSQLLNFTFAFKPVLTEQEAEKKRRR